jgi:hypothetical protein
MDRHALVERLLQADLGSGLQKPLDFDVELQASVVSLTKCLCDEGFASHHGTPANFPAFLQHRDGADFAADAFSCGNRNGFHGFLFVGNEAIRLFVC